jgi:EmrB/QacA subfamily drug resistance transporter
MAATAAVPRQLTTRTWAPLIVLCVAQFMVVLDVTVVNVALPTIGSHLSFAPADLAWVVTAYTLFTGGLMLLGGRAADLLGRRRVFAAGLALFTTASAASGLAQSALWLVVARAAQGTGAALMLPAGLALITTSYDGPARARALGVWGALGSVGAAAGVLLGGVLTSAFGWRSVFYVNVPIGIALLALAPAVLPAVRATARTRLDLPGAVTALAGLVSLLYGIEGASEHGWGSTRTLALIAAGLGLLALFVAIESRTQEPLVRPSIWRVRSLTASAVLMLGATGLLVGEFFLNTLYLQHELDASALETGLAFLPLALAILAAAHVASHAMNHAGSRVVAIVGLIGMAAGATLLALAPDHAAYATDLLPGLVITGFGAGLAFVSIAVTSMSDVGHDDAGLAAGLLNTFHELGGALGVATLSAVMIGAGGLAAGDEHGLVVAAAAAAGLAVLAAATMPAVRPAPGERISMH